MLMVLVPVHGAETIAQLLTNRQPLQPQTAAQLWT